MSTSLPDLIDDPPRSTWLAPAITGCLLAVPGLWVAVSSLSFEPHDALDSLAVVAQWGAAGGTLVGVPTGVLVARLPKSPIVGVIAGMVVGAIAFGIGAALAVGMLLGSV